MKASYPRGQLSKEILLAFLVGGLALTCAVLPGMAELVRLFKPRNARERYRLQRAVNQLRHQKYVLRRITAGREEFAITPKGKRKIARYLLGDLCINRPQKWDKTWRIVMFDIPEAKLRARRIFSRALKDIGMHSLQDSVFVSPYPCKDEIDFLACFYFVREDLAYFETDTVESKSDLMRVFDLRTS